MGGTKSLSREKIPPAGVQFSHGEVSQILKGKTLREGSAKHLRGSRSLGKKEEDLNHPCFRYQPNNREARG